MPSQTVPMLAASQTVLMPGNQVGKHTNGPQAKMVQAAATAGETLVVQAVATAVEALEGLKAPAATLGASAKVPEDLVQGGLKQAGRRSLGRADYSKTKWP